MRIAAVGDVHGDEHLGAFEADLRRLGEVDLFLLAGDLTERNDLDAFARVVGAVTDLAGCPTYAVFGNNEYGPDHARYRASSRVPILDDEPVDLSVVGRAVRIVGSTGCLDRPTWWQRTNLPGIWREYEERERALDRLLGDGGLAFRLLLTHYPPTYATMGAEKEEWRPELGSRRLEAILLRRMPDLVVHGHVHKGVPFAELRREQKSLEDFGKSRTSIPVYNVAYPVVHGITVIEV